MNRYEAIGRLTNDPTVSRGQTEDAISIARYTLAIDRPGRRQREEGQQTADFIPCVAFGRNAEFAEKYLRKGTKIGICGRFQSGSYTNKEGQKVYTIECVVTEHEFCQSNQTGEGRQEPCASDDSFMNVPDELDENLPFK